MLQGIRKFFIAASFVALCFFIFARRLSFIFVV